MSSVTQDTLELCKTALRHPNDALAKSISTATGLVAYDLQAPAKNLYPFVTPIRNVMPRVGGGTGTATNWRQVSAIIGSGFDAMGWVPEGQRSGQMSYSTASKSATFVTIGEEDAATFEAISAGREFRRHPVADDLSPAAKDDAEGGNGDPRRQCLAAAGHAGHPDPVGVRRRSDAAGRRPITSRSWR